MKRIVFRGELAEGVTRRDAAAALARLFPGRSAEAIETELFRGRAVVVRRAPDATTAARYARALQRAGLVVHIEEVPTPPSTPPRRGRAGALAAIGALAGILVGLGAAAAWYSYPLWAAASNDAATERLTQALATADLVALAGADLDRMTTLESRALGPYSLDGVIGAAERLTRLNPTGVAPPDRIDSAVFALAGAGGADTAGVVVGDFDPTAVRERLARRYRVIDERHRGDGLHLRIASPGCAGDHRLAIRIDRQRVIWGAPERVATVAARAGRGASAGVDLDRWRQLRSNTLAGLAVFAPQRLASWVSGEAERPASSGSPPRTTVYAGAHPELTPPGIALHVTARSSDDARLAALTQRARAALVRWRRAGGAWPELTGLAKRVRLERGDAMLRAKLRLPPDGRLAPSRLLAAATQQWLALSLPAPQAAQARPTKAAQPTRGAGAIESARLAPFARWGNTSGFGWQGGPFAARLAAAEASDETGHRLQLMLRGRELPGVAPGSPLVEARVERVADAGGVSVRARDGCGATVAFDERVQGVAAQGDGSRYYEGIGARDTITLADGTRPGDVAKIVGRIRYRQPTRIADRRITLTEAGQSLDIAGVRLRITHPTPRRIAYTVAGAGERLLDVRALDADGNTVEALAESTSPQLGGGGRHVVAAYAGEVAAIEPIVAEALTAHRYRFRLDGGRPPMRRRADGPPRLPRLVASNPSGGIDRPPRVDFGGYAPAHTTQAGPLVVSLDGFRVNGDIGLYGALGVYARPDTGLARRLNAVAIGLDGVILANGRVIDLDAPQQPVALARAGAHWSRGHYETDPERPWLEGRTKVHAPGYAGPQPRAVVGHVTLREPRDISVESFPADVGARWSGDGVSARVSAWRYEPAESIVTLALTGASERVVAATAHDAAGDRVDAGTRVARKADGGRSLRIDVAEAPTTVRLYVAESVRVRREAFRIALTQARSDNRAIQPIRWHQ